MRPGDIITSINGVNIQDSRQVQQQVEAIDVGTTLQMTVIRNGNTRSLALEPVPLTAKEAA